MSFEKWKAAIDGAKTNPLWNGYDAKIRSTVAAYNKHLPAAKLDWKLVKAMVWTESGGPSNPAWKTRPMQIGNPGDPGLAALLSGKEGGELVMPPEIAAKLTEQDARSKPESNIEAGVGYLLLRLANYAFVNKPNEADGVHDYVVKPGDSFAKIAQRNQTTVPELQLLNPALKVLHPRQTIKIKKAKIQKSITSFKPASTKTVAALYNTKDPNYAAKLDYCLAAMQ